MADQKTQFTRTDRQPKNAPKGQAGIILRVLDENKALPFTITGLTEYTVQQPDFVTRQDPERVVAYYLCIFKKQGLVTAGRPVVVADEPTASESSDEPAAELIEA
jgi:hypothetical protein